MSFMRSPLLLGLGAVLMLSACGSAVNERIKFGSQYWQRVSSSESIYMRGPKAQQILNRDIARCVTELRELERLGAVKNAIPTDISGRVLDPDETEMAGWDAPERDQHLFAEHSDYHDFEGCMLAKGWERVLFVPYDVSEEARDTYLDSHVDHRYRSRVEIPHARKEAPTYQGYGEINE